MQRVLGVFKGLAYNIYTPPIMTFWMEVARHLSLIEMRKISTSSHKSDRFMEIFTNHSHALRRMLYIADSQQEELASATHYDK